MKRTIPVVIRNGCIPHLPAYEIIMKLAVNFQVYFSWHHSSTLICSPGRFVDVFFAKVMAFCLYTSQNQHGK